MADCQRRAPARACGRTDVWRGAKGDGTSASVEDANAAVSAVVNLVAPQRGVAVRLDPHARHGIVEDFVVLDEAQT